MGCEIIIKLVWMSCPYHRSNIRTRSRVSHLTDKLFIARNERYELFWIIIVHTLSLL
jgi:hypothetical protein